MQNGASLVPTPVPDSSGRRTEVRSRRAAANGGPMRAHGHDPRARTLLALPIICAMFATAALADWPALGGPGVTVADPPAVPNLIACAPDGSGGMFVGWLDARAGSLEPQVYVRRIDAQGNPLWADDGIAVNTARSAPEWPAIASDGEGGAIIAWRDFRADTAGDIYAQHLHADGSAAWPPNGVAVTNGPLHERYMKASSDGAGGVFVSWDDDGTGSREFRVQHVGAGGPLAWAPEGIVVSTLQPTMSTTTSVVSDGEGGALVGWASVVGAVVVPFAQRLSPSGARLWAADGVLLSTNTLGFLTYPVQIAADGTGGALAILSDGRSQNSFPQAFAQRVDASGN